MAVKLVLLPRHDDGDHVNEAFQSALARVKSGDQVLLDLAYWPPTYPTPGPLLEHLESQLRKVAVVVRDPPALGDVPPELFDLLSEGTNLSILEGISLTVDQLFRHRFLKNRRLLRTVKEEVALAAAGLIDDRFKQLNLFKRGHFELPGGQRTNVLVRFGALLSEANGMDGLREFIGCVAAREIAVFKPATIAYWSAVNHRVLPHMVRDIVRYLRILKVSVDDIRLGGELNAPVLAAEDARRIDRARPLVVVADVAHTDAVQCRCALHAKAWVFAGTRVGVHAHAQRAPTIGRCDP